MRRGLAAALAVGAFLIVAGCEATPVPSAASPTFPASASPASSASPSASTPAAVAVRWDAPADGSTVTKRHLTVRAAADDDGAIDGETVTFSVGWPGTAPRAVCEAKASSGRVWECDVDLAGLKAPSGTLRLDFDVNRGSGEVEESPDGKRSLDYRPPAPTWRAARTILPKACDVPALAVDSGRYHVASTCGQAIRYAEGSATGAWSVTRFQPPARHTEVAPQLAVDGHTLYMAYTRYGPVVGAETCGPGVEYADLGVYYRTRALSGGRWSKPRRIGREGDVLDGFRVVDGTIHATVVPNNSGRAVYVAAGSGSTARVPLRGASGGTSLRVGDDGKPRVAYVNWRDGTVRLATIDGTTVTSAIVASKGYLVDPLLVLGGGNQPHLVWTRDSTAQGGCEAPGPAPADGTYYATLVDGRWVSERITKATGATSLVLDTDTGAVHVLVNGNPNASSGGRLTHFERAPGGGWTATPLTPRSVESGMVIRRDESDGTLVVMFKDRARDPVQMLTRR